MFKRSYIFGHLDHPHYLSDWQVAHLQKNIEGPHNLNLVKNMADPTKFQILKVLSNCREICVSDLSLILNLPHSAISHALKDLRNIGLVEVKKCKKLGCYALTQSKEMKKIQNLLRVMVKEVNLDG